VQKHLAVSFAAPMSNVQSGAGTSQDHALEALNLNNNQVYYMIK